MTLLLLCMYKCVGVAVCDCGEALMLRSEDDFMKSILSFHLNMGSKDQTQVCVARAFTRLVVSLAPDGLIHSRSLSKKEAVVFMPLVGSH